jgi:putative hydrolase of the HAD superfamily
LVSIRIADRVVVFDYGEVISRTPTATDRAVILELAGCTDEQFWPAYWRHRDDLDRGALSVSAYWRLLAAELGLEYSPSRIQELWAADFRSWISVEPATVDLLAELQAGGTRMALLSNAGLDFGDAFRSSPLGDYFEQVFVSAELDLIKPDPEIYRYVAGQLNIATTEMVFIDNKLLNVTGAVSVGATGHHFTSTAELDYFLRSLASETADASATGTTR